MSSDAEHSDYEKRSKRTRLTTVSSFGENDVSSTQETEPLVQSAWGDAERMSPEILTVIFHHVVAQEGCLPSLVKYVHKNRYFAS